MSEQGFTMFPPILADAQNAFNVNTEEYKIYFTLPRSMSTFTDVKHIQIRLVKQANNLSIVNTNIYPDGIIYKNINEVESENNQYYISILSGDLAEGWIPDTYYKVQLRFGRNFLWSEENRTFYEWKNEQVEENAFSEWSTVMLIKAINVPELKILNYELNLNPGAGVYEDSNTPLFIGQYSCQGKEYADKYKFTLYSEERELLEETSWIQADVTQNIPDSTESTTAVHSHRFRYFLQDDTKYIVTYSIQTQNGYETSAKEYEFLVQILYSEQLPEAELTIVDNDIDCLEEGYIKIYFTNPTMLSGNLILSRTCEKDGYSFREELYSLNCYGKLFDGNVTDTLIYKDFSIESGVKYKYFIQLENYSGVRTPPLGPVDDEPREVNFEYRYLFRDGIQLKLKYDNTMSSFKHTMLAQKQDTMGSKFPFIFKNGKVRYAEIPITGLITLHSDENENFFEKREDGYYFKQELVIASEKYTKHFGNSFDTNLTDDNIFIERKFRETVESWLQEDDYKLFKSATEGNIVVSLTNVSLSPKENLGRMIYSFSATAYEVAEGDLSSLLECGILRFKKEEDKEEAEEKIVTGQLPLENFGNSLNVLEKIKEDCEEKIDEYYTWKFKEFRHLSFECHPKGEYEHLVLNISETDKENTVIVRPYREYHIDAFENLTGIELSSPESALITYVCKLELTENKENNKKPIYVSDWGQLPRAMDKEEIEDVYEDLESAAAAFVAATYPAGTEYVFHKILYLEIEADEDSILYVNEKPIVIGEGEKYNLNPADYNIQSLRFAKSTAAIVNYQFQLIVYLKEGV